MSRKLNFIPHIHDYEQIRRMMQEDLDYRLADRTLTTSLGRPLYYRINVQLIMTHECPFHCPFCLERQNPMEGKQDFPAQLKALAVVLKEHPQARLTVTGGEPGLYPEHVKAIESLYNSISDNVFMCVNTTGIEPNITTNAHINLSSNKYVQPDPTQFPDSTLQTVLADDEMTIENIKNFISSNPSVKNFSFRFLSSLEKHDYSVDIWNDLQNNNDFHIHTFRVGDFFVYATFDYKNTHCRVTLGDMYQQKHNVYQDGYSNIIIHPDGTIKTNWR